MRESEEQRDRAVALANFRKPSPLQVLSSFAEPVCIVLRRAEVLDQSQVWSTGPALGGRVRSSEEASRNKKLEQMTRKLLRVCSISVCLLLGLIVDNSAASAQTPGAAPAYLITNDDNALGESNSATFFTIANGVLSNPTLVNIGGIGSGGGYFASNRVNVLNDPSSPCVFLSSGTSNTISGVQISTQTVTGNFPGSATDNGADNGVGMVMNGNYLYANFSTSGTIATFAVQPECELQFLSDISPAGLNGGTVKGMALTSSGDLLVVTYGDGSIQSFNVSGGVPVPNGDEQNATGFASDNYPDGVDITEDGHYAIFGDASSTGVVEVSDISSGSLTPTVLYSLERGISTGFNSNNVRLSPDGRLLYITNNSSGQVMAAFFDRDKGAVFPGCISAQLNGFDSTFSYLSGAVTEQAKGTGSVLYVAEFGQPSAIAVIDVSIVDGRLSGQRCKLTEAAGSPISDPNSLSLLSIEVYPSRQF
jgi:6-phosphogluconolactonase (cycloisomerase 2 family)